MDAHTHQECGNSRTCTGPQRQGKCSKQQTDKAADQHIIDHSDHASRRQEDLPPGGMHRFPAQGPFPIIMRGGDEGFSTIPCILELGVHARAEDHCAPPASSVLSHTQRSDQTHGGGVCGEAQVSRRVYHD